MAAKKATTAGRGGKQHVAKGSARTPRRPSSAARAKAAARLKKTLPPHATASEPPPTEEKPPAEPSGVERRHHLRVPYGAWVTVNGQSMRSFCLAQDLSEGGIYLKAAHPPPLGEELDLTIVIENDSTPLELRGQVVRRSQGSGGFAVRFLHVQPTTVRRLQSLVSELAAARAGVSPPSSPTPPPKPVTA